MFALGRAVDGITAAAWGLANAALPADAVDAAADEAAKALAARPAGALSATKRLMRDGASIWAHMQAESRVFGERLMSAEAREAFTAFAERRAPDFSKV
jgi:enoyl-CoA hydratase/carnithine racemase